MEFLSVDVTTPWLGLWRNQLILSFIVSGVSFGFVSGGCLEGHRNGRHDNICFFVFIDPCF